MMRQRDTYYLLGKNRSGSGIRAHCSFSALNRNTTATTAKMPRPSLNVFVFQFLGCEYQPPAGDQTCLG